MSQAEMYDLLYDVIAQIETPAEAKALLEDLCTLNELDNLAQRLTAAKLLAEGLTYQEIMDQCGISSATLSRVSRALQDGQGYQRLFQPPGSLPS